MVCVRARFYPHVHLGHGGALLKPAAWQPPPKIQAQVVCNGPAGPWVWEVPRGLQWAVVEALLPQPL